jgi:hypothetical protein
LNKLPFRANATWLANAHLILLDVLFDRKCVAFSCLRNDGFRELWNLAYSHDLDDDKLMQNLRALCKNGVLESEVRGTNICFGMTAFGGQLWSEERRPDWERFCSQQGIRSWKGLTITRVFAVRQQILRDFLRLSPRDPPTDRAWHDTVGNIAEVEDHGLIPWRPFPHIYCGGAIDTEFPNSWECEEYVDYQKRYLEHHARLNRERTWWENVPQLQRFVPGAVDPTAEPKRCT